MTVWIVLGCMFLALVLLLQLRVGGFAEYSKGGVLVRLKIGPLHFTAYPVKKKNEKRKKKKKEAPAEEEPPAKSGGSWAAFQRYWPLIADAAGQFKRRVRIEKLYLDFTAAATDPAMAAMEYGYANAAVGMLWPVFEHNFDIKARRIRTAVDFNATTPTAYVYGALSLTMGQAIALAARLALRFLKLTPKEKPAQKTEKEAV